MKVFMVPSKLASNKYPDKVRLLAQVLESAGAFKTEHAHAFNTANTDSDYNSLHAGLSDLVVFALTRSVLFQHRGRPEDGVQAVRKLVIGRGVHEINDALGGRTAAVVVFVDEPSESSAHFTAYVMPNGDAFTRLGPDARFPVASWQNFTWCDWKPVELDLPTLLNWPTGKRSNKPASNKPAATRRNLAVAGRYLRARSVR